MLPNKSKMLEVYASLKRSSFLILIFNSCSISLLERTYMSLENIWTPRFKSLRKFRSFHEQHISLSFRTENEKICKTFSNSTFM